MVVWVDGWAHLFVPCSVGECQRVGSIELCVEARTAIYQAHTCILHMQAHTRLEARTHADTWAIGCKAMHACARSFTYTVVICSL